jgi:hypothetical protein
LSPRSLRTGTGSQAKRRHSESSRAAPRFPSMNQSETSIFNQRHPWHRQPKGQTQVRGWHLVRQHSGGLRVVLKLGDAAGTIRCLQPVEIARRAEVSAGAGLRRCNGSQALLTVDVSKGSQVRAARTGRGDTFGLADHSGVGPSEIQACFSAAGPPDGEIIWLPPTAG